MFFVKYFKTSRRQFPCQNIKYSIKSPASCCCCIMLNWWHSPQRSTPWICKYVSDSENDHQKRFELFGLEKWAYLKTWFIGGEHQLQLSYIGNEARKINTNVKIRVREFSNLKIACFVVISEFCDGATKEKVMRWQNWGLEQHWCTWTIKLINWEHEHLVTHCKQF